MCLAGAGLEIDFELIFVSDPKNHENGINIFKKKSGVFILINMPNYNVAASI